MSSSRRRALLLALILAGALSAPSALATPSARDSAAAAAAAQSGGEANEILIEVAYVWTLRGTHVSGTVTNGDTAPITGTGKLTARSGGRTITVATGGRLSVAAGAKQTLSLTLSKAGRAFFKRRTKATAELVLVERAGTRSGDETDEVRIHKVR